VSAEENGRGGARSAWTSVASWRTGRTLKLVHILLRTRRKSTGSATSRLRLRILLLRAAPLSARRHRRPPLLGLRPPAHALHSDLSCTLRCAHGRAPRGEAAVA